jgi:hypothetical protein
LAGVELLPGHRARDPGALVAGHVGIRGVVGRGDIIKHIRQYF